MQTRQQGQVRLYSIVQAALAALLLVACSRGTDEEQIRQAINTAEKSAEARSTSKVIELVADDYRDDLGGDKTQLQNLLRGYFLTHPKIELLVHIKDITIESPSSARAQLEVSMLGTVSAGGDSSSLTAESQTLRVDFRRIDSKWRVVRVERRKE